MCDVCYANAIAIDWHCTFEQHQFKSFERTSTINPKDASAMCCGIIWIWMTCWHQNIGFIPSIARLKCELLWKFGKIRTIQTWTKIALITFPKTYKHQQRNDRTNFCAQIHQLTNFESRALPWYCYGYSKFMTAR